MIYVSFGLAIGGLAYALLALGWCRELGKKIDDLKVQMEMCSEDMGEFDDRITDLEVEIFWPEDDENEGSDGDGGQEF